MHFCYKVCESWLGGRQHRTKLYFTRRKHRERTARSGSVKRKGKYSNVTPITWKQIPSNEHPWKLHNDLDSYHWNTRALLNSINFFSSSIHFHSFISLHFCFILCLALTSDSFPFTLNVFAGTTTFIATYRKNLQLNSQLQSSQRL